MAVEHFGALFCGFLFYFRLSKRTIRMNENKILLSDERPEALKENAKMDRVCLLRFRFAPSIN